MPVAAFILFTFSQPSSKTLSIHHHPTPLSRLTWTGLEVMDMDVPDFRPQASR
jgi:hypothetical protein